MIAVPSPIRSVRPPIHASGETASDPYASDVQTEWNPHRSASSARPTQKAGSSYPSCRPRRTRRSYSRHVALPGRLPRGACPLPRVHGRAPVPERAGDRARGRRCHVAPRGAPWPRPRRGPVGAARTAGGGWYRPRLPLLRLPERGDRALGVRPARLRLPGARRRERRDPPPLRHRRPEAALPAPAGGWGGAIVLRDDRAGGVGIRSDAAPDAGRPRRGRMGDRRAQVVLERSRGCGVRGRLRDHGSRRRPAPARDDAPRPGRRAGGRDRPPGPCHGTRGPGWSTHCEVRFTGVRVPAANTLGGRETRSPSPRSASARGGSTT